MKQTPDGGEPLEVIGSFYVEEGVSIEKHSDGWDKALDDALEKARLAPGTYKGKVGFELGITVTNPPRISEYKVVLSIVT